jgi:hypothetical protein
MRPVRNVFQKLSRTEQRREGVVAYLWSVYIGVAETIIVNNCQRFSLRREFKSEIESAKPAKRAKPSYSTMLCEISCELAGCVHWLSWTPHPR